MTKTRWLELSEKAFELHFRKNQDYGGADFKNVLGLKGRFSDVFRKIARLKTALWDSKELLVKEGVEDTAIDLVVYSMLMWDEILTERKSNAGKN